MRRKDREIIERNAQLAILKNAEAVHIAFAVDNEPYIVAMNFGFIWEDTLKLYLHCAREGKKIDMMRRNSRVCFQMDTDHQLVIDQIACRWSMNYAGIVGRGTLIEVTDENERFFGLNCLMANYGKKGGA
ncbi:MAG: pyridoxamine 5'-phosphate oxidase family protein, partial [Chitinispirillaceae bacterium]|nr:pyridoxamine 5'-phosphate oxidase family protein [Chitinispirillaceae bacterium]